MFCFICDGILSFECIRIDLRVLAPLKMTCTLVCRKVLLNSLLRLGTLGTEMKIFFLTSRPVSGFMMGFDIFFSVSLNIQFSVVVFGKNSLEVVLRPCVFIYFHLNSVQMHII